MGCTSLLVGRKATNDGSTIMARNEDCGDGDFQPKKMVVVEPADQPRTYTGVASHLTIQLPDNPLRYTCVPTADQSNGVWGEAGINAANVAMTATETISTNARVLGADPLVTYQPAKGTPGTPDYQPEKPGGIGEENLVTIILPYIQSAKEGVQRMGELLEKYGTYEMNGVGFSDENDIWYIETLGGHHWIARRLPEDCYAPLPNRQGIDFFDLRDAFGEQKDFMCSADLPQWMAENHLFCEFTPDPSPTQTPGFHADHSEPPSCAANDEFCGIPATFNPRTAFSSFTWLDIVYNNPRAWYMASALNRSSKDFIGPDQKYQPGSFDVPWCLKPDTKLSVMDVKNLLSSTYDGTPFDPYSLQGTPQDHKRFRFIGINRTSECSILQVRPYVPKALRAVQWVAFASGPFNTAIAIYTNVKKLPAYLDTNPTRVSTDQFYWTNRLVQAMADVEYFDQFEAIMGYQQETLAEGYAKLKATDAAAAQLGEEGKANLENTDDPQVIALLEQSNAELTEFVRQANDQLLGQVLFTRSVKMHNAFGASDH